MLYFVCYNVGIVATAKGKKVPIMLNLKDFKLCVKPLTGDGDTERVYYSMKKNTLSVIQSGIPQRVPCPS